MAKQANGTADHNQLSEQEQYRRQQFMRAFAEVRNADSDIASRQGDLSALYSRMQGLGFTKNDFKFAKSLQDKDVSVIIAEHERRIWIAKLFGHQLGRQTEMFDEDRTPAEDRAYQEGHAAGMLRKENQPPYDPTTPQGQAWQKGFNQGTEDVNKDLDSAVNGDDQKDDA